VQGLVIVAVGALALVAMAYGWLGGSSTPLFLVPWAVVLVGGWRAAAGLLAR
jgi:hypothetical protein